MRRGKPPRQLLLSSPPTRPVLEWTWLTVENRHPRRPTQDTDQSLWQAALSSLKGARTTLQIHVETIKWLTGTVTGATLMGEYLGAFVNCALYSNTSYDRRNITKLDQLLF